MRLDAQVDDEGYLGLDRVQAEIPVRPTGTGRGGRDSGGHSHGMSEQRRLGRPGVMAYLAFVTCAAAWCSSSGDGASAGTVAVVGCEVPMLLSGRLRCGPEDPRWRPGEIGGSKHAMGTCRAAVVAGDAVACVNGVVRQGRMSADDLEALGVMLDLNVAPPEELWTLPGVGPRLADRIVAVRPFELTKDVRRVRGIGPRKTAGMLPRLCVDCPSPLITRVPGTVP